MVMRSRDQARDEVETLRETKESLDELRTTTGQGASALRNSAGHRVKLAPESAVPLLTVDADDRQDGTVDVALRFTDDGLEVVARDGSTGRGLKIKGLTVETIGASVSIETETMGAKRANIGTAAAARYESGNNVFTGTQFLVPGVGCNADPGGSWRAPHFYGGTFHGVLDSERDLKDHLEDITDGLEIVRRLVPARFTWKDPERDRALGQLPGVPHAGIYVNELADAAPEAVRQSTVRAGSVHPVLDEEIEGNLPIARDGRTYDDRAVLAYLVSAVQTLAADRDRERARNDELEARVGALERDRPRG